MSAVYQGRVGALDFLLTIYDDGTAEAKVRRADAGPWDTWSAPIPLRREPLAVAR